MSTFRPPISRPVVTRVIDVEAVVERLDPTRHRPTVEYDFSNGRKFVEMPGRIYAGSIRYGDQSGTQYADQSGELYGDGE